MTDFFDKIYSSIVYRNSILARLKWYSFCRFTIRLCANIVLPVYFRITSGDERLRLRPSEKKSDRYIVTLTTIPSRLNKLWLTLETLLRQTHQPDAIVVWLSESDVNDVSELPSSLLKMKARGVDFRIRKGGYRSHRKYYYALQEFPADNLITVDDDIFYNSHVIEQLILSHTQFPQAVVASYTHDMIRKKDGTLQPYAAWPRNVLTGKNLFFGSGGGTLFPPKSMPDDVLDMTMAMNVCPTADDVWLNAMVRAKGTPIVRSNFYSVILPVMNRETENLSTLNITRDNDVQLRATEEYLYTIKK